MTYRKFYNIEELSSANMSSNEGEYAIEPRQIARISVAPASRNTVAIWSGRSRRLREKTCSPSSGAILIDILIALTLASMFIFILGESSNEARDIFIRANERNKLLDAFEANPEKYQAGDSRRYGNDRVQTDFIVSDGTTSTDTASSTYSNIYSPRIKFTVIQAFPYANMNQSAGTPLCSVDFARSSVIGSYFILNASTTPVFRQINLPVDPLFPLTDVEVRNGTAYISSDSSNASDPDLFVIDIHDADNPIAVSSINTGPGLAGLALDGKRIFAAAASTVAQLHIIRFDLLNAPTIENKYKLPLPYATATPPYATSIFYDDDFVYFGTEKWAGDEFNIVDISNPANPVKIGGLETGSKINDIYERDGIAYIAASDEKQLRAIDASVPSKPTLVNSFSPSGWQRQEGKSLSFFEDLLDFGRTSGGYDRIQDHELFEWVAISSTTLANRNSTNIPGGIYGIVRDESRIYAVSREANKEFQIFNIDPLSQTADFASSTSYSLPFAPQTITCDGDKLYVLSHSSPTVYEITFK